MAQLESLSIGRLLSRSKSTHRILNTSQIPIAPRRALLSTSATSSSSSVDSNEVQHFNRLASSWWDPHGPSRLLHLMNPLRHTFIESCLRSQADALDAHGKLHFLDVGCGGGIFAESAARLSNCATVTAIDPTPDVLAIAKAHARRDPFLQQYVTTDQTGERMQRLRYLNIGIEDLPVPPDAENSALNATPPGNGGLVGAPPHGQGYDVLTLFEVLEHVSNPSKFLSALLPHVKPGGWLILSTIARTWTSWLTTKVLAEEVLRIVPSGTHDWNKYINDDEVAAWFEKQNDAASKAPQWINPRVMGVVYVPLVGWKEVPRSEQVGNYFFGVRRAHSTPE